MAATITQANRFLSVETPLGEDVLLIDRMTVNERLSVPYSIELDLMASVKDDNSSKVSAEALIGHPMAVRMQMPDNEERFFHGIVSEFKFGMQDGEFAYYSAELVPWLSLLGYSADCRVFQSLTVLEILQKIFDEWKKNLNKEDALVNFEIKTEGTYRQRDYCVQYRETYLNFVSRLMEEEGLFYFFKHEKNQHTLVVGDSIGVHEPLPKTPEPRLAPSAGHKHGEDVVLSWGTRRELIPGSHVFRDYQFQQSSKKLEWSSDSSVSIGNNSVLEVYDFPGKSGKFYNSDDRLGDVEKHCQDLAKIRMQEETTPHLMMSGSSTCRDFSTGYRFMLTGHGDQMIEIDGTTGKYVLTSIRHVASQSPGYSSGWGEGEPYRNTFSCISYDAKLPFRPQRVSRRSTIHGLQSAVVVGKKGEEIYTDKYGRVRVQFHWDRKGKKDDNSSCWVRVAQSMAGTQWGAHFWPRIGHEVLVAFMEGDPDQPIIVGSVYNADNMPPYEMPQHQTRSGIKTRSSPNGGPKDFNELRFEDKKDKEQIYIHAERNLDTVVESNETRKVGHDRDTTIEHNDTMEVKEVRHADVGSSLTVDDLVEGLLVRGKRLVDVYGNDGLTVLGSEGRIVNVTDGDHSTRVDLGNCKTEAMQSIEFKVGGNSIKIDQTGITIKGILVNIEGTGMAEMKSPMTTVKGSGMLILKGGITMIN